MTLRHWSLPPCPTLAPFIDRFWGWQTTATLTLPPMLPGTGSEAFFHLAPPPCRIDGTRLPQAYLVTPRGRVLQLTSGARLEFIAIRFKSGQLRHLTGLPFAELNDQLLSWPQLWGYAGEQLLAELGSGSTIQEQIALLQRFLLAQLQRHHQGAQPEDSLIQRLYYEPTLRIESLAQWSGWSRRQLERRFQNAFAIAPKRFARLARLQHTVRAMVLVPERPLLEIGLDSGFCDQPHLIHEFQELTGLTPLQLRQSLLQGVHYYHAPLRQR